MFPFKNGLKQRDAYHIIYHIMYHIILILLYNLIKQDGLKLNGTHQHLVYAVDINILCRSVYTIKKNTEAVLVLVRTLDKMSTLIKLSTWLCLEIRM